MELESQVAKIQLGPENGGDSFIFVGADKLQGSANEAFIIAEISETDPKLFEACEQICLSIFGAIKRSYKKTHGPDTFESAIAHTNEELSKLVVLGQTHWVEKLNCIIAVKQQNIFHISTIGKISAMLFRDKEFTNLGCSPEKLNPLKTFENFASGKLQLNDLFILSTSELFNHISLDRLKGILNQEDFLKATGQLIEILKANTAGRIPFGSILAKEAQAGTLPNQEINLEEYIETTSPSSPKFFNHLKSFAYSLINPAKKTSPALPHLAPSQFFPSTFLSKIKQLTVNNYRVLKNIFAKANNLSPSQIKQLTPQKKFFFISVSVLLFALILQIIVAIYFKGKSQTLANISQTLALVQKNLDDANSALLYKDELAAKKFFSDAQKNLEGLTPKSTEQKNQYKKLEELKLSIGNKLEKTLEIDVQDLGVLANGKNLIALPNHIAIQSAGRLISYNKTTGTIKDNELKLDSVAIHSQILSKERAVIYDGTALKIWDFVSGDIGPNFSTSVPEEKDVVNLSYYPTKQRVYLLNKNNGQIVSFAVLDKNLAKPEVALTLENEDAKNALNFAIDGSIYLLTQAGIKKYHAGALTNFSLNILKPLNNPKKIFVTTETKNIYILDSGNQRIVMMNKQGNLIYNLTHKDFTDLVDFVVEEKTKTIFVLNGSSLLKLTLP